MIHHQKLKKKIHKSLEKRFTHLALCFQPPAKTTEKGGLRGWG